MKQTQVCFACLKQVWLAVNHSWWMNSMFEAYIMHMQVSLSYKVLVISVAHQILKIFENLKIH